MKQLVVSLVLLFAVVLSANAQGPDKLIAQLSKETNVTNVKIGGFLMAVAKPFIATQANEVMPIVNGIKTVHVLAVEGCSDSRREEYISLIKSMEDKDGYETIVQVADGEDHVRIMVKTEKDTIKGMYIFCVDNSEIAVVKLLGEIKDKDIEKVLAKYNKND